MNCNLCGKPFAKQSQAQLGGNPKLYHMNCVMEASRESRERSTARNLALLETQKPNAFWHAIVSPKAKR